MVGSKNKGHCILFGLPLGIPGRMKCFLDRVFNICVVNRDMLGHKVDASVVAVRRYGGIATCD